MVLRQRAAQGTNAIIKEWRQALDGIPADRRFLVYQGAMAQMRGLSEIYAREYIKEMTSQQQQTTTTRSTAAPKKPGGKKGGKVQATRGRGTATRKRSATGGKIASSNSSGGRGRRGNKRQINRQTRTGSANSEIAGDSSNSQLH